MRPGQYSVQGFLGETESLDRVLLADRLTLKELGLQPSDLAVPLGLLLETAIKSKVDTVRVGPYKMRLQRHKGAQICPFAPQPHEMPCPGKWAWMGSVDWEIRHKRTGVRLAGPGLIVHLISEHGFFEGVKSRYRVEPTKLAELLELGPFFCYQ